MEDRTTQVAALLADYVVRQRSSPLSHEVSLHATRALVDWFAAAVVGSTMSPVPELRQALSDETGHGRSRLIDGTPAVLRSAALINGVCAHAAEVDDVYRDAVYHPGSPTIAAALAVAAAQDSGRDELLRAIIAGYEISIRIAAAVFKAHYTYWHPTGTVGAFGAAAAAASLLDLTRVQTAHALSTAATFAAGLQQAFRSESMTKPLHAGRAAEAGVLAALAARSGVSAALGMIEGRAGFGAAMGGDPDWHDAFSDLGSRDCIAEITFKNHCCCGQAFASIDAALGIRKRHGLDATRIRSIRIATYDTALKVAGSFSINGPSEARFSIPYLVAHALVRGSVRLDAVDTPARSNPAVLSLMARTEIVSEPRYGAVFPGQRCADVTIEMDDGVTLREAVTTRKGDPDDPLSDDELDAKFEELCTPIIGQSGSHALLATLRDSAVFTANDLIDITTEGWRA